MNSKTAKSIFLDAIDHCAPDKWSKYVDQACGDDAKLRHEVEQLLAAHQGNVDLIREGQNAWKEALPTFDQPLAEDIRIPIGPYKLLEQIGEGGMGVVYMAQQSQPVKRRVAIKVVKPGMDSRQVIARFEAERQALAMMDHPNIAKMLDGGQTETGRPYFVMELVRGMPITEYCDRERLDTRRRLQLFTDVCRAVQHAHTKAVIHRDLKPSNVLITLHDGVPVVKVIDFGVAKALNQELTERTMFTQFSQLVGTPLYMSPEQAELSGLDIDTRSDIYSLGVLLYELLTSTTPFAKEQLSKVSLDEMRRMIREDDPPRPSHRISTLNAEARSTVSRKRSIDVRRMSQHLRGELDWIVMKALEKDRNRRYESASNLAADIQRYLNDEPVQACPPSASYQFRKFARRNKGPVIAASLIALGLVAVTALSLLLVARERDLARHVRELSDRDRQLAQRRAEAQGGINSALAELAQLRQQAGTDALGADALARANELVQRALALAETGGFDEVASARVQRVADELQQEQRDRRLLAALEQAWLAAAASDPDENRFDYEAAIPLIDVALSDYGIAVGDGDPIRAARELASRSPMARDAILAALEDWYELLKPPFGIRLQSGTKGAGTIESVVKSLRPILKAGDRVIGIGQGTEGPMVDTRKMRPAAVEQLIRGEAGNVVRMEVLPQNDMSSFIHVLRRDPLVAWLRAMVEAADHDPWRRRLRQALDLNDTALRRADLDILATDADLEQQPEHIVRRLAKGLSTQRAIELLRRKQQRNPGSLWLNFDLAYRSSNASPPQYGEAVRYYTAAVALRPESGGLHNNLGVALADLGKRDEAVVEYQAAVRLNRDRVLYRMNLVSLLAVKGDHERATAESRELLRLTAGNFSASMRLVDVLRWYLVDFDQAIEICQQAIPFNAGNSERLAEVHRRLGELLSRNSKPPRWEDAAHSFQQALEAELVILQEPSVEVPTRLLVDLRQRLNYALIKCNQRESLEPLLRKELAIWPRLRVAGNENRNRQVQLQLFVVHHLLAVWLQSVGRSGEAETSYLEAKELLEQISADSGQLLNSVVGYLLAHHGKLPPVRSEESSGEGMLRKMVSDYLGDCVVAARQAVQASPTNDLRWNIWSLVSFAHYRERDWAGAEVEARLAAEWGANRPDQMSAIVPLFLLAGKNNEYREICERLMDRWQEWKGASLGLAANLCTLAPEPPRDPERLLRLARRSAEEVRGWGRNYLKRAYYLVGELDQALAESDRSQVPLVGPTSNDAILYYLVGRHEEARNLLNLTREMLKEWDFGLDMGRERMREEVMFREAERLIDGQQKK